MQGSVKIPENEFPEIQRHPREDLRMNFRKFMGNLPAWVRESPTEACRQD